MKLGPMREMLDEALDAAGRILRGYFGRVDIQYKGRANLLTQADLESQKAILTLIMSRFPEHDFKAEEAAVRATGADFVWVIDPLDGTTNYAHGFPVFCVSIGVELSGQAILGVVYNPMLDELFLAQKGKGAFLNNKKIRVSKTASLDRSLLATGFPYDIRTSKDTNLNHFERFAVRSQAIRRAGSAALDLSCVACGRFDGFWEMKLKPWDTAAAALFVKEAGGVLTDFKGNPYSIYAPECLASNGLIHDEMLAILAGR